MANIKTSPHASHSNGGVEIASIGVEGAPLKRRSTDDDGTLPTGGSAEDDSPLKRPTEPGPEQTDTEPMINQTSDDGAEKIPSASDADWLRSRTSRLLDLVDEDELEVAKERLVTDDESKEAVPSLESDNAKEDDQPAVPKHYNGAETQDSAMQIDATQIDIDSKRLFVRNLPYKATESSLRATFSELGTLSEVSRIVLLIVFLPL